MKTYLSLYYWIRKGWLTCGQTDWNGIISCWIINFLMNDKAMHT